MVMMMHYLYNLGPVLLIEDFHLRDNNHLQEISHPFPLTPRCADTTKYTYRLWHKNNKKRADKVFSLKWLLSEMVTYKP